VGPDAPLRSYQGTSAKNDLRGERSPLSSAVGMGK
jgi:hypothetical protein